MTVRERLDRTIRSTPEQFDTLGINFRLAYTT